MLAILVLLSLDAPRGAAQGGEVVGLTAGWRHTCAVTTAGGVKCWGNAHEGRLGNGQDAPNQLIPVDAIALADGAFAVTAGYGHTCALVADGGVKCWGNNFRGPLGDGTQTNRFTAVAVCANAACNGQLSGAVNIEAGDRHTCALMTGGGIKCWGSNAQGQLGDGQACGATACLTPVDVQGLAGAAIAVSGGIWHTCAVLSTGSVQCWGTNFAGQLGNGTTNSSSVPVTAQGISDAVAVAAGGEHTCAVTKGGGVKCWGINEDGQLGAPSTELCGIPQSRPCSTTPLSVAGLSGVTSIALGEDHACAVTTSGALKCWGGNSEGQLGDGQACGPVSCSTPVEPTGLGSNIIAVAAGSFHTCALLSDSKLRCMGANGSGQLGDGTGGHFDDRSTLPVAVVGLGPADSDGDTLNDGVDVDDDNDGCLDARELSSNAALGGRRSPKVFWDFFDTPIPTSERDRIISIGDVFRVVARFGANGNAGIDPLSPPAASGYHTAFDRSAPAPGGEPWDLNAPDGSISAGDILFEVNQFGHSCA